VNKRKSVVNDARKQIDELRLNTLKRTLTTACTNKSNAPTQADSMQIQNTTMNNSSGEQTVYYLTPIKQFVSYIMAMHTKKDGNYK
jgi:hypothetical protein